MAQLGVGTFGALTEFALTEVPDPDTIVVTLNGEVVPEDPVDGWFYLPQSNEIMMSGDAVPRAGDILEATYNSACD